MRRLALGLVLLILSGCAQFGYQRNTVAMPRDPLLVAVGEARATYRFGKYFVTQGCETQRIDAVVCRIAADVDAQAQAFDGMFQLALARGDTISLQDLQVFMQLVARLSALAGYPILGNLLGGTLK